MKKIGIVVRIIVVKRGFERILLRQKLKKKWIDRLLPSFAYFNIHLTNRKDFLH